MAQNMLKGSNPPKFAYPPQGDTLLIIYPLSVNKGKYWTGSGKFPTDIRGEV